jgi:opacity protein-like surface antigen
MIAGHHIKILVVTVAVAALARTALAQPAAAPPAPAPGRGYAEVVAQSAFGNVTSQSFGGEVGVTVKPGIQIFVDAGRVRDAAPASLGARAQTIAAGISRAAGGADFRVRQPVTFGVAGVKYLVPVQSSKIEPYILGGGGVARVAREVTFSPSAGDLSQFVTLGSDLTGSETAGMISVGGGLALAVWPRVMLDLQYRFGRVFTSEDATNVNRAGAGIGVRF